MVKKADKLNVLISENQLIRNELIMQLKTLHTCLFAFIASMGGFAALLMNLGPQQIATSNYFTGILTFVISQIEIVLIIYSILLHSDIFTKAAYISHIEHKINTIVEEDIVFWESKMSNLQWKRGTMFFSTIFLYLFYSGAFIVLGIYSYDKSEYHIYSWIQSIEVLVIAILLILLAGEYSRMSKHIRGLKSHREK